MGVVTIMVSGGYPVADTEMIIEAMRKTPSTVESDNDLISNEYEYYGGRSLLL